MARCKYLACHSYDAGQVTILRPKDEPAQFVALRAALRQGPVTARDIARRFKGAPRGDRLTKMLRTLEALGQARPLPGDRFAA